MSCQTLCAEDHNIGADTLTASASTVGGAVSPLNPPLRRVVYGPTASPNGFTALAGEWNKLLQRSRVNAFFLTYEWQTTWWESLGTGDLWIIAFRRPDTNELVGIAPLYLTERKSGTYAGKRVFTLVGCIEVSDYLDLIIARDWEAQVYTEFLAWLNSSDAPAWDVVDLCNLPEACSTYTLFPPLAEAAGLTVQVKQEDVAPQFALPLHYEIYLQEQVDKKQRHEIRRKQRRAEREANVGFYIVGKEHSLEAEVDDFVALQRASREDKAEFMTPEMRRFFGAAARRMLEAGYLRLCFLTLNGEKAACLYAFEYDHKFLLYNSGYDPDAYSQLSPGWVLLAYSIQYAIAAGCRVFDFMQGNEEYKYRFGSQDYNVMRVIVTRC
ncbi:MAG: GNAT family N-acetyltransferase [Caldilineaceae bacterium]|nr:GNAT family N-acetyltransferase [Caldilineaceae bacterium]